MTPAERRFKQLVRGLVRVGIYPSPGTINDHRARGPRVKRRNHDLNGRDNRWRGEVLRELGWTRVAPTSLGGYPRGRAWRRAS